MKNRHPSPYKNNSPPQQKKKQHQAVTESATFSPPPPPKKPKGPPKQQQQSPKPSQNDYDSYSAYFNDFVDYVTNDNTTNDTTFANPIRPNNSSYQPLQFDNPYSGVFNHASVIHDNGVDDSTTDEYIEMDGHMVRVQDPQVNK